EGAEGYYHSWAVVRYVLDEQGTGHEIASEDQYKRDREGYSEWYEGLSDEERKAEDKRIEAETRQAGEALDQLEARALFNRDRKRDATADVSAGPGGSVRAMSVHAYLADLISRARHRAAGGTIFEHGGTRWWFDRW